MDTAPQQQYADLLGETRPATDAVLLDLARVVADIRTHDHTPDDVYCDNLHGYAGQRMGSVLRRLADTQAECASLTAAIAEAERALHAAETKPPGPAPDLDGEPGRAGGDIVLLAAVALIIGGVLALLLTGALNGITT